MLRGAAAAAARWCGPGPGGGKAAAAARRCWSAARRREWVRPAGRDSGIVAYNSRSRSKEPLVLAAEGVATWYSCGPTVYDQAHLGHACSYVRFDILRRIMTRFFGIEVIMVMGITDIDDKIIKRANEMNISPVALARIYEEDFKQDMAALKVLPPTVYMRVTDNIPQIISFIKAIIASGQAYATSQGNVYFDVKSLGKRYGVLTTIHPDNQDETVDTDKRHGKDFALWKAAKPQELSWTSPWGKGRPGWHIECSTISSAVFGKQLDIHTGGIDLAFPHHENEIAQCEVYHQCEQWGNYFLHSGHLHVKGSQEKMSKSLKNYVTIKDFLKKFSSDQFRMFCLRSRYSSAVEFSDESMDDAKHLLQAVSSFIRDADAYIKGQLVCDPVREDILWERLANTKVTVKAAFADDFDTSRAVAAIMDLIHHGNRQLKAVTKVTLGRDNSAVLSNVIEELVRFRAKVRHYALALPEAADAVPVEEGAAGAKGPKQEEKEKRQQLMRERKPLLEACDSLRGDLAAFGIHIKDRAAVSTWEIEEGGQAEQQTGKKG
ncbi:putative cysteine--tRNA ligase, mitochondrial isoform X4 [Strix aluco]|uniref:putative cysteine--tRNA ligase, mitochondrial isoform X4 n=1 Tax=Strix aluco TaxID=111821 RepID=UPI003DA6BC78